MTVLDRKRARGELLELLWASFATLDDTKAKKARMEEEEKKREVARKKEREREAQSYFRPSQLVMFEEPLRGIGIIGVVDLTSLLGALSVDEPEGLAGPVESQAALQGAGVGEAASSVLSWIKSLRRRTVG